MRYYHHNVRGPIRTIYPWISYCSFFCYLVYFLTTRNSTHVISNTTTHSFCQISLELSSDLYDQKQMAENMNSWSLLKINGSDLNPWTVESWSQHSRSPNYARQSKLQYTPPRVWTDWRDAARTSPARGRLFCPFHLFVCQRTHTCSSICCFSIF